MFSVTRNVMISLVVLLGLVLLGFNVNGSDAKNIIFLEKKFDESQKSMLVAHMNLNSMFPDTKVRAMADAAGKGKIELLEKIIAQGVPVNSFGKQNATPLFWALRSNNIKGFTKLLEFGADPNVIFSDGASVIHWSVVNKSQEFLVELLKHKGDPNLIAGQFEQPPLFETISIFGDINKNPALDILLNAGADINLKRKGGDTAAIVAAKFGRFDIVYKLLSYGADYKLKNNRGESLGSVLDAKKKLLDHGHELFYWLEKVEKRIKENK